ncbi:MAG: hypothetical protein QM736_16085 [Vicinamibacterales bacterium]
MRGFCQSSWCRIALTGVLATIGAAIPMRAQQPTFRSSTQIVSLFATVTDGQNRLVPDLTRDDFQVFDNDKLQQLIVFESQNQPITVVVMLDTSASMTASIKLLKDSAEQFLVRLLPEDKAAVGAFNDRDRALRAVLQRSRSAHHRSARPRLRQRHAPLRRGCRRAQPAPRRRRPEGDPRLHRR